MKRFFSWFRGPGGALIAIGVLAGRSLIGLIWHRLADWELAQNLWVEAGGSMPYLVTIVSAWWFSPALIIAGFSYTVSRWTIDKNSRGRAYGQLMDRVGWAAVISVGILITSTIVFDVFLTESGATDFAEYVKGQRFERHLSSEVAAKIVKVFSGVNPPFKIMVFAVDSPEASAYGKEFMAAFHEANQTVNGKGQEVAAQDLGGPLQARIYSTQFHGLLIGAKSNAEISESKEAIRFKTTLSEAGITVSSFIGWDGLGPEGFNFIVGPK